ncbi:MAG: hypothetical protein QXU06_04425 [Candidatus Bathyarchaeia archaeon]
MVKYDLERGRAALEGEAQRVDGRIRGRAAVIPNGGSLGELRERGFGELRDGDLILSPYEAFYLIEKGRLRILDPRRGGELPLEEVVRRLSRGRAEVWLKYLVFKDLRDRGYIVRDFKGMNLEVYGKGPQRRIARIIYEGGEASLDELRRALNASARAGRELILAVVDRRTDIVYYSLGELEL